MSDNNHASSASNGQYVHTNNKGVKFYLFTRFVTMNRRRTPIFFFSLYNTPQRVGDKPTALPAGFGVRDNPRFPVVYRLEEPEAQS